MPPSPYPLPLSLSLGGEEGRASRLTAVPRSYQPFEAFTIENVPARVAKLGDLWQPLLDPRGRFDLGTFV